MFVWKPSLCWRFFFLPDGKIHFHHVRSRLNPLSSEFIFSLYICHFGKLFMSVRATFVWPWKSVRYDIFHGPMFGKIKTKLLLIPAKETHETVRLPNHVTAFQMTSKKVPWRDDVVCIASAFAKGGEIRDKKTVKLACNVVSLQVWVDVSRFSPCMVNLSRNKNICCGLKKVVAKSRARVYSFFIKLTTCRATSVLVY